MADNQQIKEQIQEALEQGQNAEQIKQKLVEGGYSEEKAEELYTNATNERSQGSISAEIEERTEQQMFEDEKKNFFARKRIKRKIFGVTFGVNIVVAALTFGLLQLLGIDLGFVEEDSFIKVFLLTFFVLMVIELILAQILYLIFGSAKSLQSTFDYLKLEEIFAVFNLQSVTSIVLIHAIPFLLAIFKGPETVISSFLYLYTFEGAILGIFVLLKLIKTENAPPGIVSIGKKIEHASEDEIKKGSPLVTKIIFFFVLTIPYSLFLLVLLFYLLGLDMFPYSLGFWPLLVALAGTVWDSTHDHNTYFIENEGYKHLPFKIVWQPLVARGVILIIVTTLGSLAYAFLPSISLIFVAVFVMIIKVILDLSERVRERALAKENLKAQVSEEG